MIFGVDLPGLLNATLGANATSATLVKVTEGTRTPGNIGGGRNPVETSYPCSGWIEAYSTDDINNTLIQVGDRKISILSRSLIGATPGPDDKITIVDLDSVSRTFRIIGPVQGGPTSSIYVCQGRL